MLTRTKVFSLLKKNGLRRNTHNRKDYMIGKTLFESGKYITEWDYQRLVQFLNEYFGL